MRVQSPLKTCYEGNVMKVTRLLNIKFCNILVENAKVNIPRGKQYNYHWSKEFKPTEINQIPSQEESWQKQDPNDVIVWKNKTVSLKRLIVISNRNTQNRFIEWLNYRTDGLATQTDECMLSFFICHMPDNQQTKCSTTSW